MNKLTKLGIVTFSAVTLSAAVPTLVRAEENVAPQPNVAAQPNTTQPTPAPKPVKPAENAGLPKIPYRNDQPKRWFNNGTGRPTLTTNDLAVPLPAENVEKTSYGWWTADPDLLHAGSHIKVNTFNSNFNNPMFENGKEIKFKGSGFGDMDSRFKPALVRVKVPELEGMNYEAYTIFYEVPNKNGKPTYGTNRTLQGGGISLTIKSKEKKEDIQVYTLTKDRKLEELYYLGFPSEETNRYDEKTKTHSYNLYGETYDTYVFLFKNPAEKPAEQVKPEVKPSEQPKPDKQPSVPTVPAEQPQPAKPVEPTEKPSEKPVVPDTPKPVTPAVPDQSQPAKPEKPAEKPSENPSASENPVNPANPAKPEVKPAEQPQENNIKSVRKWRLADGSFHEHPILTYADIVAPLPISDMKQTPINGIWTAEKDFVNNKPRLTLFWGSGNRYFEENGKEFSREELMKSTMYMYPIRVKIPELEGRNYEAYTIYTGISDKKTGHVELNKNTNITGEGYMVFRTKKEDNDVEVYQFSKNRQLAPLYSSRQLNERGRSVGEFGLSAEVYQTYVFLFKNPAEKPAEQVKPEVKPSEQPKPDKQPSVPTVPADQSQPAKPVKPTPTQSGWSGSSYYQNGVKVTNKWIFDKKYNSYFYLNASGNYVQNAWVGNYYLKSGGYMAKSEWIYDKNYGSYYYLTSEGSYARNTWVGNYYLKSNGKMAKSEWIYDKNYGAYYYLTAEGSYARNAWSGSYYLKSNGKMAKGEWVYDSNYKSYYYLTAEGSYARNTWVGDYYLKSNGKMAVNERTPDGYQVDESGKWIR